MNKLDNLDRNDKKKRAAAEKWRRWLTELRRRQLRNEQEQKRYTRLLLMWLILLEFSGRVFHPIIYFAFRNSSIQSGPRDPISHKTRFDYGDYLNRDYSAPSEQHHLEVMDGLTYQNISQIRHEQRANYPELPERYRHEWPHPHTLLFQLRWYPHMRNDVVGALKLSVPRTLHAWLDASLAEDGGYSIRSCRRPTAEETFAAMPREARRWLNSKRQEAENILLAKSNLDMSDEKDGGGSGDL